MRRLVTIALLILVCLVSLPALSLRVGLGLVSSAGVTFNVGSWDFDANLRSGHPVISTIGPKILPGLLDSDIDEDILDSFCAGLYNGFGVGASFRFLDSTHNALSLGLDFSLGMVKDGQGYLDYLEEYEKAWILLVKIQGRYTFKINEHHGIYLTVGYPFGGWAHICGVQGSNNAYAIDTPMLIPYTLKQLEEGQDMPGLTKIMTIGLTAATVRIGYAYTF